MIGKGIQIHYLNLLILGYSLLCYASMLIENFSDVVFMSMLNFEMVRLFIYYLLGRGSDLVKMNETRISYQT
jgi:hypothetical protein